MSERMLEAGIVWNFETFDEYLTLVGATPAPS